MAAPELVRRDSDGRLTCLSCGHRCLIGDGKRGICKVRYNEGGTLHVPRGYVGALQCDPIEKKPFFHAMPGTNALSFGMLGCDLHCSYCQNWLTSQTLRDAAAGTAPRDVSADDLVHLSLREAASTLASTYNEPLITSEWAVEVFKRAKVAGLKTAYISNGNATEEVLRFLQPWVDLYKVDLKGFSGRGYRELGGRLQTVLDTIQMLHRMGFWLEIVTLVVPNFNDSESEIRDIARFLSGVSVDIPWHVTAFHADYKMTDRRDTTEADIIRAAEIGKEEGLHYVYAGNRPGRVGDWEDTVCPKCETHVIERSGFRILRNRLENGSCPRCWTSIPGVWS